MLRQCFAVLLAATLLPAVAHAAGLGIPDLGANGLAQAGAWIARPTDGTALYYNPAGLASLPGLFVEIDARLTRQAIDFQRADSPDGFRFSPVHNMGNPSIAPEFSISYRWVPKRLFPITFAIGGHPFNGMTGFSYPDPQAVRASEGANADEGEVSQATPQRYSSIASGSQIYVPVIAVAARVLPWLDIGAGLQVPIAHISSKEAIFAAPSDAFGGESTAYDALIQVTAATAAPSGIFGASAQLGRSLFAGFSFQLPTVFHAPGHVSAQLPPSLQGVVGVQGNQVEVDVTFPWIARMGLRYVHRVFELELAGTYEAWSEQKTITLAPKNIYLTAFGSQVALSDVFIHQNLRDAGSVRLGGLLRGSIFSEKLDFLVLRAGILGETSAVPEQYQTVSIANWQRISLNCGIGVRWRNYELSFAYGHFIQPTRTVTDSQVQQTVAFKTVTPSIVGNGTYNSQLDVGAVMLSAHFL